MAGLNLLITGRPRVGKTTLVQKLAQRLGNKASGFTTGEIREGGNRVGFSITSLSGEEGILAHVGIKSSYTLGRYGIDIDAMDRVGTASLTKALEDPKIEWIVVDEIGKMEEYSKAFKKAMLDALDSPKNVIATIRLHDSEYTKGIKARDDIEMIRLTVPEREAAYQKLAEAMRT